MNTKHDHSTTSNTDEVFRTFIGCTVKGLVRERTSNGEHANILVFDCGWGLAFNSNGAHWAEDPDKVNSLLGRTKKELQDRQRELKYLLKLEGG